MIVDISHLTRLAGRLDQSATLQTFVASGAFFLLLVYMGNIFDVILQFGEYQLELRENALLVSAVLITGVVGAAAGFSFMFWDWLIRQSWRVADVMLSALLGSVLVLGLWLAVAEVAIGYADELPRGSGDGNAGLYGLAVLLVAAVVAAIWAVSPSGRLRYAVGAIAAFLSLAALVAGIYWVYGNEPLADRAAVIQAGMLLIAAGVAIWTVVRIIRTRLALSVNRPRELLLGDVPHKWWPRLGLLCGLPSSMWQLKAMKRSAFWAVFSARPLIYGGLLFVFARVHISVLPWPEAAMPIGVASIVLGHVAFHYGKRLAAGYPWQPDQPADPRPPVLFLRTFTDDQMQFERSRWNPVRRWFDLWSFRRNADELLVDEVNQYGPVVAVGLPGEEVAPFGAQRYYVDQDEDWQQLIRRTARQARAVVVAGGDTPGLVWEYRLLAKERLLHKTLLLLPAGHLHREKRSRTLAVFADATRCDLGDIAEAADRCVAVLPGDEKPLVLQSDSDAASAYLIAVRAFFLGCSDAELAVR